MGIYDFSVKGQDGGQVSLKDFEGKVVLIVNTATQCGFTPQYGDLQRIYGECREQGLEILDFPCNQFGGQAPGSDLEIQDFCALNFGTQFPRFSKVDVNGDAADPLFVYLKEQKGFGPLGDDQMSQAFGQFLAQFDPGYASNSDIKWNFTKFLVDREGNVVRRFEPIESMVEVEAAIKALL